MLVFLNKNVLQIHFQLYEHERMRDPSANQDPSPPQITNMKSSLAKMEERLPEFQFILEKGDRNILLTPV